MNIVNCTPHPVCVRRVDGSMGVYPPSGKIAHVDISGEELGLVDGVPLVRANFGGLVGVPEPESGTLYVVSLLVLVAAPWRKDLIAPDTGDSAFRNKDGRLLAVRQWRMAA